MATIREISDRAGVSIATVSKVLNNKSGVKQETADRILQIADQLNYRPNLDARSLKLGDARTIGIITEEVLAATKTDELIGSFVDIGEAAREVGNICNAYNAIDIDFTVLLTHIGFEEDKKLAAMLDPDWGVDVIIGGHSHTKLEEPFKVNDIYIVQVGTGAGEIGRFDIMVDTDLNAIDTFTWQMVPIDDAHCPRDEEVENFIQRYRSATSQKLSLIHI